jgi:hypothetical protein
MSVVWFAARHSNIAYQFAWFVLLVVSCQSQFGCGMLGSLWFMVNRNHSCDWTHTATTTSEAKNSAGNLNVGLNGSKKSSTAVHHQQRHQMRPTKHDERSPVRHKTHDIAARMLYHAQRSLTSTRRFKSRGHTHTTKW